MCRTRRCRRRCSRSEVKNTRQAARGSGLSGMARERGLPGGRRRADPPTAERRRAGPEGPHLASLHRRAGPSRPAAPRPDIVFADFEGTDYGGWTGEGKAFDGRPYREDERRFYTVLYRLRGQGVRQHAHDAARRGRRRPRTSTRASSRAPNSRSNASSSTSGSAAGRTPAKLGLRLLIDGKVGPPRGRARCRGHAAGRLRRPAIPGQEGPAPGRRRRHGGLGHTTVDQIVFTDRPIYGSVEEVPGYGSMRSQPPGRGPGRTAGL